MEGLFQDLAYYGIRPPMHVDKAIQEERARLPPGLLDPLPVQPRGSIHHDRPHHDEHLDWLESKYPETFPAYRALWDKEKRNIAGGGRHFIRACRACARCARSRWGSPRRTNRSSRRSARPSLRASATTSAPTAASTSSTTSP